VTFPKRSRGPSRERALYHRECYAFGIHSLGYSRMRPHDLAFLEVSPVIARSDVEHFLPQCVTHSHPAGLRMQCSQLASSQAVSIFRRGGRRNTEPAGWSSGACCRITSKSAFCFRWLSPLVKAVGRMAKGILVRAKLCLVPYLKKLLILSPHHKGQKNTVDSLIFLLFTKRQSFSSVFILAARIIQKLMKIYIGTG